jgi:hypothetical protein
MGVSSSSSAAAERSSPDQSTSQNRRVVADLTAEADDVSRRHLSDEEYVREIHRLEAQHRSVLDELSEKRNELRHRHDTYAHALANADVTIATRMSKEEEDIKIQYQNELQEIKDEKQRELADLISELNEVIFPEVRLFAMEDIRSRIVHDFEKKWKEESTRLIAESDYQLNQASLISKEEHGKIIKQHKSRFAAEIKSLEDEVREHKRATSGIFGWLSPGSRKKTQRDEDDDGDLDEEDEDDDAHSKKKRSRR